MSSATEQTAEREAEAFAIAAGQERSALLREIECLRALVTRLTDVAENLAGELSDPGTEALAAIYCGRNVIYG